MKVGRNITLTINDETFESRIIDINDKYIYLDIPVNVDTRKTAFMQSNKTLEAEYVGDDRACYSFTTKIIDQTFNQIPKLVVAFPQGVDRIQRREFVRVQTTVDVAVHSQTNTFSPFTTVTFDISGGGLSLILPSNRSLPIGEIVDVYIILHMDNEDIHYICTTSKVLRIVEGKDKPTTVSLQFKNITLQDQQRIVQFCLEKQREIRRKELQ